MRALAEQISLSHPDIVALSEIDDGNALALATRFDLQWAYRGGQALLWNARMHLESVYESYLPAVPLPAFDRRGLLRVDGAFEGRPIGLFATRFAPGRSRIRDLRVTRGVVRGARIERALLFVTDPPAGRRAMFDDLGFTCHVSEHVPDLLLATRGCSVDTCVRIAGAERSGSQLLAGVTV
ncbi:MAG: hypothetical protein JOY69_10815 [Candidatus Eremiobacteraeota bacterium]|nr:hypothetical protein [Candidatus Eremiobacteraeota bacterium]